MSIRNRRAFVILNGMPYMQKIGDVRPCAQWAKDALGLTPEQFATTSRGYITQFEIQFFIGEDYRVDSSISEDEIFRVAELHKTVYGNDITPLIYNGVIVGEEGCIWTPIMNYIPAVGWVEA